MNFDVKQLTCDMIEKSPEIQQWLGQFVMSKRAVAESMLIALKFVSRDVFAEWLKATVLKNFPLKCALYAVRKFNNDVESIWDSEGNVVNRPETSLGSEDLVQSVFSNLVKVDKERFFDHLSIIDLRSCRIKDIVLVDDSIGSGDRVSDYIKQLMSQSTFMSWWSYGYIHLHVVSFAVNTKAKDVIIEKIGGSDHSLRKFPKSNKISFLSYLEYDSLELSSRWGISSDKVIDLCDFERRIPKDSRRGYGDVLSNIVFYHSVPNNLPGIFWYENSFKKWKALFPRRSVPEWLPQLLENPVSRIQAQETILPKHLYGIMRLIKKGIRCDNSIALRLGLSYELIFELLSRGRSLGLITSDNHLTKAGMQVVFEANQEAVDIPFDRSLYVPKKWCVGRGSVQQSELAGSPCVLQTDSAKGDPFADGEVGQTSLERTDARTVITVLKRQPPKTFEASVGARRSRPPRA